MHGISPLLTFQSITNRLWLLDFGQSTMETILDWLSLLTFRSSWRRCRWLDCRWLDRRWINYRWIDWRWLYHLWEFVWIFQENLSLRLLPRCGWLSKSILLLIEDDISAMEHLPFQWVIESIAFFGRSISQRNTFLELGVLFLSLLFGNVYTKGWYPKTQSANMWISSSPGFVRNHPSHSLSRASVMQV